MIRAAALLLCLAGDVHAQDRAEWPSLDGGPGSVTLTADGPDYLVTLHNVPTALSWGDGLEVYQLDLDGFAVVVQVWSYGNPAPDTLVVFPPAGWIAIPPTLDVHERQSGAVRIVLAAMS